MSVIYLVHPVHGAKVAISEAEAEYDETHGWQRSDAEGKVHGEAPKPASLSPRRRAK